MLILKANLPIPLFADEIGAQSFGMCGLIIGKFRAH
jgi:hypothetical protein